MHLHNWVIFKAKESSSQSKLLDGKEECRCGHHHRCFVRTKPQKTSETGESWRRTQTKENNTIKKRWWVTSVLTQPEIRPCRHYFVFIMWRGQYFTLCKSQIGSFLSIFNFILCLILLCVCDRVTAGRQESFSSSFLLFCRWDHVKSGTVTLFLGKV